MTVETPLPELPDTLPVLPLRDTIVFPMAVVPLAVGQPRSVTLVDEVMRGNRLLVLVGQQQPEIETAGPDDVFRIATGAVIHRLQRAPDGVLRLLVQGLQRVHIDEFTAAEPYLVARITPRPETVASDVETEGLRRAVIDLFRRIVELSEQIPSDVLGSLEALTDPTQVAYLVASLVPLATPIRQEILEIDSVEDKLRRLIELLQHEVTVREIGREITSTTQQRLSKVQREHLLREQMRTIQEELGTGEGDQAGLEELRHRLDEAGLPEEAQREAERELNRLAIVPAASPEHGIIQTYLDWLASLPWQKSTGHAIDVAHAREVLDADHYDLERIKDRILEHLAVKKLREERQAQAAPAAESEQAGIPASPPAEQAAREPILCFVGPPGVGKTSLGQSIARALGRKFIRIALGGVRDEAEIRGHRRTYIGAMPGRIIQAIRRAESRDPVLMLDEIDKVGADWRGDPTAALLEVLDPAQNHSFVDTYLGVPFDLSQVLFITTANTLETVPDPLRDRMEVLPLSGYTDAEKVRIALDFLAPKQITAHGLRPDEISFTPEAMRRIIRDYTREAGVRNLDREIATICRKVARAIAEGSSGPATITPEQVQQYLGRPRFADEVSERIDRPGVATGLAWTPTGGDVLFVEATMIPSREEHLTLTGMLGDVMRESAQIALGYVRSNEALLGIQPGIFDGKTVHVHVPAGAIPKDGPSAGITIMTALASLATGRPVRPSVAMTGEITLRGKVLPVGGIKEKVLAAHRAGITTVILPRRNERDLDDVPAELREQLHFVFVDTVDEVLAHALTPSETPASVHA